MSQLPKEWEAIVSELGAAMPRKIVERCYALTQKPQRELTDAEIDAYSIEWFGELRSNTKNESTLSRERNYAKAIIAAHQRKQAEPEKVMFRAARDTKDGEIQMFTPSDDLSDTTWEWLEPAQEYEVTPP